MDWLNDVLVTFIPTEVEASKDANAKVSILLQTSNILLHLVDN